MKLIFVTFALCGSCFAQSWSGILTSSRAIDWTHAGLPATLPDSETTANPWTPPIRTQCATSQCNTVSGGTVTAASLGAALVSAAAGTYVLIPSSGSCYVINNANISLYVANGGNVASEITGSGGVTLRGSGPQSTCIEETGTTQIQFGVAWNNGSCVWSAGFSAGATSLTATGCNIQPVAGEVLALVQCDSGYSGSPCAGTAPVDNGALLVCGDNTTNIAGASNPCQTDSPSSGPYQHQQQDVYVISVTGTCSSSCTIVFSPGLYMPNWSSSNSPKVTWITSSSVGNTITASGIGLEDLTVYGTSNTAAYCVNMGPSYASWIKGVRFLGNCGSNNPLFVATGKNDLVMSNYFFSDLALDSGFPAPMAMAGSSDTLLLNNITASGVPWAGEDNNSGNVVAYNYGRDTFTMYYENRFFEHHAYSSFGLREANQIAGIIEDATWGTHDLETNFRNYWSGWDPPYTGANNPYAPRAAQDDEYSRFINYVGNSLGSTLLTTYQGSSGVGEVYTINEQGNDSLVSTTMMRWGNCDTVTATCRFVSGEVPTSLSGNAVPFENSVPGSHTLPCSFFLAGYISTSCSPHSTGGTGLSWWKVCTAWSTFPTSCSSSTLQPFPPVGPDVTSGPYVNGTAYDIPASIAFADLPIDTAYQNTYSITGSSYTGTTETLTVTGLPSGSVHLMGPMQLTGTCSTGSGEVYIATSTLAGTTGTITYTSGSNPGNCSGGSMKFPDVRQFDERVYESDLVSTQPGLTLTGAALKGAGVH